MRLRRFCRFLALAAVLVLASQARAAGRLALGATVVPFPGISLLWQTSPKVAWHAFSQFIFDERVMLQADYLRYHFPKYKPGSKQLRLKLYYGLGARVAEVKSDQTGTYLRVPLGLQLDFLEFPMQVFFEMAPQFGGPGPDFGIVGALGIRFII